MENQDQSEGGEYLRSMTSLYTERNSGLRPLMPRANPSVESADVNPEPDALPSFFLISPSFRRLMERFQNQFNYVFVNVPCAYCGYLSSTRTSAWLTPDDAIQQAPAFELITRLHLSVYRDGIGRVAICHACRKKPRPALDVGPWPSLLLDLPKRSRSYLSPLKLNCNLGRTQSHSATTNYHNPWSTYRTLTGIIIFLIVGAYSLGNMYLTPNDRALCLYGGIMGAFLMSEHATEFDLSGHPWNQLDRARHWLLQHNLLFAPLIDRYGNGTSDPCPDSPVSPSLHRL